MLIVNGRQSEMAPMRTLLTERNALPLPAVEPMDQMDHGH